ncbi:MAG: hydroxymethylglutaryl-CoA lyase [Cyclobacteriaceae bacterium]|nr:hydroxymethylglutaryl-CoA lyase [Cyclobacteriaceae bacterium]
MDGFKIIECPRDAMQGISAWIPTEEKIEYLNLLLEVGFDTLDFGSFVSPRAIPQMRDTAEVLAGLNKTGKTRFLAIVVNERGAEQAITFESIDQLGYPLSISEIFQQRNSKKSIPESLNEVEQIQKICNQNNKELVVYISMGFGNPYGDTFSTDHLLEFVKIVKALGVSIISISDTVGIAESEQITSVLKSVVEHNNDIEIGAHLHSSPQNAEARVKAVIDSGVRRMDGALGGFGGCPFAEDKLTGNIPTEAILSGLRKHGIEVDVDNTALSRAIKKSNYLFSRYS